MLRSTFIPVFSTFPFNARTPKQSALLTISKALSCAPTVRQNDSPTSIPPNQLPPTSAYVHLPFCRKRCYYCDFTVLALGSSSSYQTHDDDPRITNYIQLLCREINATRQESKTNPPLKTVFFGGGTPSLVPSKCVSMILNELRLKFGLSMDAEISMEMDPGTFDAKKLEELLELDINRVSLGVQAFQEDLLKACGRSHGLKEVYEAIDIVKSCRVENWSMDLISSLPHQNPKMWEESLHLAIEAQPTHVSVYDLQVEQGTKFGMLYKPGEFPLPSEIDSADLYRMASRALTDAGYNHYEISSYSKHGFECQHNLTYWKNQPFYAFGLGAASYLGGLRFSRPRKLKDYSEYVEKLAKGVVDCHGNNQFDCIDTAIDVVMLSLRTARGLDLKSFGETYGESLVLSLCKAYKPYVESGHVICLDEKRRALTVDEFIDLLNEDEHKKLQHHIRLSDPDGFLLSNELISLAFRVISP